MVGEKTMIVPCRQKCKTKGKAVLPFRLPDFKFIVTNSLGRSHLFYPTKAATWSSVQTTNWLRNGDDFFCGAFVGLMFLAVSRVRQALLSTIKSSF